MNFDREAEAFRSPKGEGIHGYGLRFAYCLQT